MSSKPNILLILNDDMGYSDIGCYGGEIDTPNLDELATNGLRYSQFYNTARCSPSRASLLTGLHPHQTGIGILTYETGPEGYAGDLNDQCVTIAEVLKTADYRTYMSGKWHVAKELEKPSPSWPMQRGFDEFYGTIIGAGSFYHPTTLTRGNTNIENEPVEDDAFFYTDAISNKAADFITQHGKENSDAPFFQYVAYTAPHWPLHAHEEDIEKYKRRYDKGWDDLREERLERMIKRGLISEKWILSDRDPTQPPWQSAKEKEWLLRCMEVYAAQIDRMDQGIGKILQALDESGQKDNTLIIFLSDNGACAENIPDGVTEKELVDELKIAQRKTRSGEDMSFGNDPKVMPGPENTYQSYGVAWANMSNTPFRLYKHWIHEGGISTPLIMHWPNGIKDKGGIRHSPGQLPDIMATILDITNATYPSKHHDKAIHPCEGRSLKSTFLSESNEERLLFWEHEGNAAVRQGDWKLVKEYPKEWELYNMSDDRTEMDDLSTKFPDRVQELIKQYEVWANRCGVVPREKIIEYMESTGNEAFWENE